jgi:hypothetical protein
VKPSRLREPFATIVDRVNERDRAYFRAHPTEGAYLRPYVPGEYPPEMLADMGAEAPDQDAWVLVWNVTPGIRCREPVGRIDPVPPAGGRITLLVQGGTLAKDVPVVVSGATP